MWGAFYWDNPSLGGGQVSLLKYGKSLTLGGTKANRVSPNFQANPSLCWKKGCPFALNYEKSLALFGKKANRVSPNFQANLSLCWKKGKQSVKEFELPSALTSVCSGCINKCLALAGCKIGDIFLGMGQITAPSVRSLMPLLMNVVASDWMVYASYI